MVGPFQLGTIGVVDGGCNINPSSTLNKKIIIAQMFGDQSLGGGP